MTSAEVLESRMMWWDAIRVRSNLQELYRIVWIQARLKHFQLEGATVVFSFDTDRDPITCLLEGTVGGFEFFCDQANLSFSLIKTVE